MRGKEQIHLCEIYLKANDSIYNSTIENTNGYVENTAGNSPIGCKNIQEHYFKDNYFLKKAPPFFDSEVFYRFRPSPERSRFSWFFKTKLRLASFSSSIFLPRFMLDRFFSVPRRAQYLHHTRISSPDRRFFTEKWIMAMTLEVFS